MKKLLSILMVSAAMLTLVACGPSADEKATIEKAKQDSISALAKDSTLVDSTVILDTIKKVEEVKK